MTQNQLARTKSVMLVVLALVFAIEPAIPGSFPAPVRTNTFARSSLTEQALMMGLISSVRRPFDSRAIFRLLAPVRLAARAAFQYGTLYPMANYFYRRAHDGREMSANYWVREGSPRWEEAVYSGVIVPVFAGSAVYFFGDSSLPFISAMAGVLSAYVLNVPISAGRHVLSGVFRYQRHPSLPSGGGHWTLGPARPDDFRILLRHFFWIRSVTAVFGLVYTMVGFLGITWITADVPELQSSRWLYPVSLAIVLSATGLWTRSFFTEIHRHFTSQAEHSGGALPAPAVANPIPTRELSAWAYGHAQASAFYVPRVRLLIRAQEISLQDSKQPSFFRNWQPPAGIIKAFLSRGITSIELPEKRWASAEDLEQAIQAAISAKADGELDEHALETMVSMAIATSDTAALQFLIGSPKGQAAILKSIPWTHDGLGQMLHTSDAFCQTLFTYLVDASHASNASGGQAYRFIVRILEVYWLQNSSQDANFPAILHDHLLSDPTRSREDLIRLATAALPKDRHVGAQYLAAVLPELLSVIRDEGAAFLQKEKDVAGLTQLLSKVDRRFIEADQQLVQVLEQQVLPEMRRCILNGLGDVARPKDRGAAIAAMRQFLDASRQFPGFEESVKKFSEVRMPLLTEPEGAVVQEKWVMRILDLVSQDDRPEAPSAYLPLIKALVAQLQLYPLFILTDDQYPWVQFSVVVNRIHDREEYAIYRQLANHLFEGFAGNIGTSVSGEIRNISRRGDYDSGLQGFMRGEIHLRYGPLNLPLLEHVLTAYTTGEGADLRRFMKRRGFEHLFLEWQGQAERGESPEFVKPAEGHPEQFFRKRPELPVLLQLAAATLKRPVDEIGTRDLLSLSREQWATIRKEAAALDDKEIGSAILRQIQFGDVRLFILLSERYNPLSLDGLRQRLMTLKVPVAMASHIAALRTALQSETLKSALDQIVETRQALRAKLLAKTPFDPASIRDEMMTLLQERRNDTSDVVQALGSFYPSDYKFNFLMLDLLLDDISQFVLSRLRDEAFAATEKPDYQTAVMLLHHALRQVQAMGVNNQEIEDLTALLELRGSTFTLGRLKLLSRRILDLIDLGARLYGRRYGRPLDKEIQRLEQPALLGHLSALEPTAERLQKRLPTHLINQMLFATPAINSLQSVASLCFEPIRRSSLDLATPLFTSAESDRQVYVLDPAKEPRGVPITADQRDGLSEKGANLLRAARYGVRVGPALMAPIGLRMDVAARGLVEKIPELEQIVVSGQVETRKGMIPMRDLFGSQFGVDMKVAVRSGALFDLPGLMLTIPEVGICIEGPYRNIDKMEKRYGMYGAWDSYRWFVQEYGMANGIPREAFSEIIEGAKKNLGVSHKNQLSGDDMKMIAMGYHALAKSRGVIIPQDPYEQLVESIRLVHQSWSQPAVQDYLRTQHMEWESGSAVLVLPMVSGNVRERNGERVYSGAGVAYTRRSVQHGEPHTSVEGSFVFYGSGLDVADGIVRPMSVQEMDPELYKELRDDLLSLSKAVGHDVEIEFTIQEGVLFTLQLRHELSTRLPPKFVKTPRAIGIGDGLAGGAAAGIAVTEAMVNLELPGFMEAANKAKTQRLGIIVFMDEATPDKTYLLRQQGIIGFVAAKGGKGQHAQRIAATLKQTAIAGVKGMRIVRDDNDQEEIVLSGSNRIRPGEPVSIDGLTGAIYPGVLPIEARNQLVSPELVDEIALVESDGGHAFAIPSARAVFDVIRRDWNQLSGVRRWTVGPWRAAATFARYLLRLPFVLAYDWLDVTYIPKQFKRALSEGLLLGYHAADGRIWLPDYLPAPSWNPFRTYLQVHEKGATEADGLRLGSAAVPFVGWLARASADIVARTPPLPSPFARPLRLAS